MRSVIKIVLKLSVEWVKSLTLKESVDLWRFYVKKKKKSSLGPDGNKMRCKIALVLLTSKFHMKAEAISFVFIFTFNVLRLKKKCHQELPTLH